MAPSAGTQIGPDKIVTRVPTDVLPWNFSREGDMSGPDTFASEGIVLCDRAYSSSDHHNMLRARPTNGIRASSADWAYGSKISYGFVMDFVTFRLRAPPRLECASTANLTVLRIKFDFSEGKDV